MPLELIGSDKEVSLELVEAMVADIEPSKASAAIALVSEKFPLSKYRHLKRVRRLTDGRLQIILYIVDEDMSDPEPMDLTDIGICIDEPVAVSVPKYGAPHKDRLAEWGKVWPQVFHESMLRKQADAEKAYLNRHIESWTAKLEESHSECLLIRPNKDSFDILAHSIDESNKNALKHSSIVAIDIISSATDRPRSDYLCTGLIAVLRIEPCLFCAMALLHSRIKMVIFMQSGNCHLDSYSDQTNNAAGILSGATRLHMRKGLNHHFSVYKFTKDTHPYV